MTRSRKRDSLIIQNREAAVRLSELCRQLPGSPHYETLRLWCRRGQKNRQGRQVFMEFIEGTSGMCSSMDAFWRFLKELNQ